MNLSKSKIIAFRQCPKRLWLEIHKPHEAAISKQTQASLKIGYSVGEIARSIYDPENVGNSIDIDSEGFKQALARSQTLTHSDAPIFEAGFSGNGLLAFADVMLPLENEGKRVWKMIEVKSSTSVKEYHRDDIAVQSYVAQIAGFPLQTVSIAHIDSSWTYPGDGDYSGLLSEKDLTESALSRTAEVEEWVTAARQTLVSNEPDIAVGNQCSTPFDCGFYKYCTRDVIKAEFPISWLPRLSRKTADKLEELGVIDLRDVPDSLLNESQKRVKKHTVENTTYFDIQATSEILRAQSFPAYFLDFETINFAIPIWAGTRPYQQVPFQYSLHVLDQDGVLSHSAFLDISGSDPSRTFSERLIAECGNSGPVYVYNAGFEGARLKELSERFPDLVDDLKAISLRLFDLLPLARDYFYHPSQSGSWSIKKVLPALAPELSYSNLEGVQDGGMAMDAFAEAIHTATSIERKRIIEKQLLAYCKQDTFAMVRIWQIFIN